MRKHFVFIVFLSLFLIPHYTSFAQNQWITKDKNEWPQIAMINEVWYKNGEQYIHPSFEYAGTGFLIKTGTKTLAVTGKHILWIAKTKDMKTVSLAGKLEKWIMHPKGNLRDSVVIDQLINSDTSEFLQGPQASVQERDWIVFTTQFVSPKIKALIPGYRLLKEGEKVYYLGCPYDEPACVIEEATVIRARGNRIIFSKKENAKVGGASGSPIIDSEGFLVGILGGTSINHKTGEPALYGISTHYLQKVLNGEKEINKSLIPIGVYLQKEIEQNGIEAAVEQYNRLSKEEASYFTYNFQPEAFNHLGKEFIDLKKPVEAIAVLNMSLDQQYYFSSTHTLLGKAYLQQENLNAAKKSLEEALKLWPENEEAKKILKEIKAR